MILSIDSILNQLMLLVFVLRRTNSFHPRLMLIIMFLPAYYISLLICPKVCNIGRDKDKARIVVVIKISVTESIERYAIVYVRWRVDINEAADLVNFKLKCTVC